MTSASPWPGRSLEGGYPLHLPPSTAPFSPPSPAPPTSSPPGPASSWLPLAAGLSGPPWPRCTTAHCLTARVETRRRHIDRPWFQEDGRTLVSLLSGKCGRLLPQHKSGPVHEDLPSLLPIFRPQNSAARQKLKSSRQQWSHLTCLHFGYIYC